MSFGMCEKCSEEATKIFDYDEYNEKHAGVTRWEQTGSVRVCDSCYEGLRGGWS